MSKAKTPRALKSTEASASASVIQASPRKVNLVAQMTAAERSRGLIGASTGNHGQSIAYARVNGIVPPWSQGANGDQ